MNPNPPPFDLANYINVAGAYAFDSKALKNLRPFIRNISAQMIYNYPLFSQNQAEFEKVLNHYLGNPKLAPSFNKWSTIAFEIINMNRTLPISPNYELLRMWIDSYHEGWTCLQKSPMKQSKDLLRLQCDYLYHLIDTNNAQDLKKIVGGWSVVEREWIARYIPSIDLHTEYFHNVSNKAAIAAASGLNAVAGGLLAEANALKQHQLSPITHVGMVFPEYFKCCIENNINQYIALTNEWLPFQQTPLWEMTSKNVQSQAYEHIQRIAKCMGVLALDEQKEMAQTMKDLTDNDQQIWTASPLLQSLWENLLLSENVEQSSAPSRRSKI